MEEGAKMHTKPLNPIAHCKANIRQSAKWYQVAYRVVVCWFLIFPALSQAALTQCTTQQIQNFNIQCGQTAASFLANEAYCVGLYPDHNVCGYHSFLGIQPIASGGLGCKLKWVKPPSQSSVSSIASPVISNALTLACSTPSDMPSPPKNAGNAGKSCEKDSGNNQGNPINMGVGNKHQHELDYIGAGEFPLRMERTYNGNANTKKELGIGWNTNYDREIFYDTNGIMGVGRNSLVILSREDGKQYQFTQTDTSNAWIGDADSLGVLVQQGTSATGNPIGWTYTTDQGDIETYNASGKLTIISNRAGLSQTLRYSCTTISPTCPAITPATVAPSVDGLLLSVTDYAGRQMNFTYDASGRIAKMIDSNGGSYSYVYNNALPGANLTAVIYPDDTPADLTNNPKRTYIYGELANTSNVSQPNALTGIIDENTARYATYKYDTNGKAISTEHAGSVEKYSMNYAADGSSTTVTDPLGSVRTTHFATILGVVKSTGTDQPGGSGCAAASNNITYDANGNIASRTDFNGHRTNFIFDLVRNLETSRTEGLTAAGATTPQTRIISTEWHPTFRLPAKITEPGLETSYIYDSHGQVSQKILKDTVTENP